jgi:peptidyl-prolyl cis-trans isomerase SurA
MKIKAILLSLTVLTTSAQAKLLDKVAGVINDKVFTLSEINRVSKTVTVRKEIAPFIYTKSAYSNQEVLKLLQNTYIIKDKLSELGFIVSDDSVEARIRETEKGLGLSRDELYTFLDSKGITYSEYFEILREAMEFNIFNRRIIAPLVTITDQELKNFYYKANSQNKALSFKYKLLDFTLPASKIASSDFSRMPNILNTYRTTGNIPEVYSDIESTNLGELLGDDLPSDLRKLLQNTDEESFTAAYSKDGIVHFFYVAKKDLTESADFLKSKNAIYAQLFSERASSLTKNWFSREGLSYYTVNNL